MKILLLLLLLFLSSGNLDAIAQSSQTIETSGAWSPYLVGALIGVLSWFTFYFSGQKIGASSFYATVAGFIGKAIAPKHTMKLAYYQEKPPTVNWEFMFVASIIFGAMLAAFTGGEFALSGMPALWLAHHGADSLPLYGAVSFLGGLFMAFGARLAGGCTSGHGISGTLQLSVSSWITIICIFLGGAVVIKSIF